MPLGVFNAADGFAMAMVVILTLSLGVVALLVHGIYRSGKRRESEVDKLLDEVRRDENAEKHPAPSAPAEQGEPWEKDEDWWKK